MWIGAKYQDKNCEFTVWAPYASRVDLVLRKNNEANNMERTKEGYWKILLEKANQGLEYMFQLDKQTLLPDPASNFQPRGVFEPSAVIDHDSFKWQDNDWKGISLKDMIFYELHIGTFTPEGTFNSAEKRICELVDLGINALELMPVTQFSGSRNWGYDPAFIYAVQNTYGLPDDLKHFVNECHRQNIAVFSDIVYNHAGPEGNFLNLFGPYFLKKQATHWGPMVNFDGHLNGPVRDYFFQNALFWLEKYHFDGLRLDAVLSMIDSSPVHFLQQLTEAVHNCSEKLKRKMLLIAESGYNQPKVLLPRTKGGFEFDAQWLDDFQHALFALLTGEQEGYYGNYGKISDLMEILVQSYLHVGGGGFDKSFRRRRPNEDFLWIASDRLIAFAQNHDQIGNRLLSDRLTTIAGFEAAKVAAGVTLLSPYTPLLFMGEEYAETVPFNFFVDYTSKELSKATREGRVKEFGEFHWKGENPDPADLETFESSKLCWDKRYSAVGKKILSYYKMLIQLRKHMTAPCYADRKNMKLYGNELEKIVFIHRCDSNYTNILVANLNPKESSCIFPIGEYNYVKILDSSDVLWNGPGEVLPCEVKKGDKLNINGFNLAVFESN
jgi:maltooligosyltrehalose trehalohydrolase